MTLKQSKLTRIERKVLIGLENEPIPIKAEDLVNKLHMNLGTIQYGLKLLYKAGLINKAPDLKDLRKYYYYLMLTTTEDKIDNGKLKKYSKSFYHR